METGEVGTYAECQEEVGDVGVWEVGDGCVEGGFVVGVMSC